MVLGSLLSAANQGELQSTARDHLDQRSAYGLAGGYLADGCGRARSRLKIEPQLSPESPEVHDIPIGDRHEVMNDSMIRAGTGRRPRTGMSECLRNRFKEIPERADRHTLALQCPRSKGCVESGSSERLGMRNFMQGIDGIGIRLQRRKIEKGVAGRERRRRTLQIMVWIHDSQCSNAYDRPLSVFETRTQCI